MIHSEDEAPVENIAPEKAHLRPPVSLTFLAPANRCNQSCPACYITEIVDEPVRSFDLSPSDYARFVQQFLDENIPIVATQFQGYEVTLPEAWPYVEAVFRLAQGHGIRQGFITNGMLLHKRTQQICALDIGRISISLDGATPEINDRFRGLPGAFDATCDSVKRFLAEAPGYRDRVAIASLLRGEDSFQSLLGMPAVLRRLGVPRWLVSVELGVVEDIVKPLASEEVITRHLEALQAVAEGHGIEFHGSPEYDVGTPTTAVTDSLYRRFFYRLDPTGHVLVGRGIFQRWTAEHLPYWNPRRDFAPAAVGYWSAAAEWHATVHRFARSTKVR